MALSIDTSRAGVLLGQLYAGDLPPGGEVVGSVQRSCCDAGALVRLPDGRHVQVTAGALRALPPLNEIPRQG